MDYESEEQQVEALKKWWKENGMSVVFGALIGLGIVLGWKGWQGHIAEKNAMASQALAEMFSVAPAERQEIGRKINEEFGDTVYADFASFAMAKVAVNSGDMVAAEKHLRRVVDRAGDPALADIARLRLARVLLDQGKGTEASSMLTKVASASYMGEVHALRGDIAAAAGDKAAARDAYQKALRSKNVDEEMLKLKLDDLAPAGTTG